MFLPDNNQKQQPIIQSRQQNSDFMHYNPLKRSSIPVLEGIHQSNSSSSIHYNNAGYSQTPHPSSNISMSSQNINDPRSQNINDPRSLTPQDHYQSNYSNNLKQFSNIGKQ